MLVYDDLKKFIITKQKRDIEYELRWEKLIENLTRKKQQVKHVRLTKERFRQEKHVRIVVAKQARFERNREAWRAMKRQEQK